VIRRGDSIARKTGAKPRAARRLPWKMERAPRRKSIRLFEKSVPPRPGRPEIKPSARASQSSPRAADEQRNRDARAGPDFLGRVAAKRLPRVDEQPTQTPCAFLPAREPDVSTSPAKTPGVSDRMRTSPGRANAVPADGSHERQPPARKAVIRLCHRCQIALRDRHPQGASPGVLLFCSVSRNAGRQRDRFFEIVDAEIERDALRSQRAKTAAAGSAFLRQNRSDGSRRPGALHVTEPTCVRNQRRCAPSCRDHPSSLALLPRLSLPDRSSQQPYAHSRTDRQANVLRSATGEAWRGG